MGNGASVECPEGPLTTPSERPEMDTSRPPQTNPEMPVLQRIVSSTSKAALGSISNLEEEYTNLEVEFVKLSHVDSSDLEALHRAKNTMAQLMGNIDKFQFSKVDSIVSGDLTSGRDEVIARRKNLNTKTNKLRDSCISLHEKLCADIKHLSESAVGQVKPRGSGTCPSVAERKTKQVVRDTAEKITPSKRKVVAGSESGNIGRGGDASALRKDNKQKKGRRKGC